MSHTFNKFSYSEWSPKNFIGSIKEPVDLIVFIPAYKETHLLDTVESLLLSAQNVLNVECIVLINEAEDPVHYA